jgi:AhpD family alkylhydroperoxidase
MARITYIDPSEATGRTKELLDAVRAEIGGTPNTVKAMAGSAVLEGYLGLTRALAAGHIRPPIAERIALAVAESNECSYCLSAHSYVAERALKIDAAEIDAARHFESTEPDANAALKFAGAVVRTRGGVPQDALDAAREAGLTDAQLAEIVGHIALTVLTNYFNRTFAIDIEFPVVEPYRGTVAA